MSVWARFNEVEADQEHAREIKTLGAVHRGHGDAVLGDVIRFFCPVILRCPARQNALPVQCSLNGLRKAHSRLPGRGTRRVKDRKFRQWVSVRFLEFMNDLGDQVNRCRKILDPYQLGLRPMHGKEIWEEFQLERFSGPLDGFHLRESFCELRNLPCVPIDTPQAIHPAAGFDSGFFPGGASPVDVLHPVHGDGEVVRDRVQEPRHHLGVDPYRLRRALDLKLASRTKETVIVTGGSEPRRVSIELVNGLRKYRCDCPDFARRALLQTCPASSNGSSGR
jgi:hypothetical protein